MKIAITSSQTIDKKSNYGMCKRIATLADSLVTSGHHVDVYAKFNSKTKANLFKIKDYYIPTEDDFRFSIYHLVNNSQKYDIIHATDFIPILLSKSCKCPVLYTFAWGDYSKKELTLFENFKNVFYIAQSHYIKNKYKHINWAGVIYTGVDTNYFKPTKIKKEDYFLFLGRITKEKGIHLAVKLMKKTNQKFIIAGQIEDDDFFKKEIKPYLSKKIKYIGEANYQEKLKYLQNAKALLMLGKINESCSNSILESLACGTPVIARDTGSNSELVTNNLTGFIFTRENQLENIIKKINLINRTNCRQEAINRFSDKLNALEHIKLYRKIIKNEKA